MVVAGPEGFLKNQYRKFNIKSAQSNDDFGMMREVMGAGSRRAQEEDPDRDGGLWPDLVLIDGGKGQMSSVRDALEELGIEDVPLVAVAKGPAPRREGARCSTFPTGARRRCRSTRRCCSTSSGCATRRTASPSAPTAPSAAAHYRRARSTRSPASARRGSAHCCCTFGTAGKVRAAALEDLQRAPGVSESSRAGRLRLSTTHADDDGRRDQPRTRSMQNRDVGVIVDQGIGCSRREGG
jgi:excinuclease ABC subunit C